jgi:hypothetical protein
VEWQGVHLMLAGGGIRGVVVHTDEQSQATGQRFKLKPELETLRDGLEIGRSSGLAK